MGTRNIPSKFVADRTVQFGSYSDAKGVDSIILDFNILTQSIQKLENPRDISSNL